jgi:hypothetical protein
MATTTTNFGWDIPQSTDLVKDGATAIAALGQDIDTALVDLKGGTTGQVLAKASGTDLDFSWVAQDDSNAIQNAIVDAKGDLIAATAADTPARLAVGTNGHVLTADSTASTGIKWAAPAGGGKILQVVFASTSTTASSASTSYADTGLTATITPSSASSRILVLVNHPCRKDNSTAGNALGVQLHRDATSIYQIHTYAGATDTVLTNYFTLSGAFVDSPSTTSATVYKTRFRNNTTSGSVFVNENGASTITLLEIGA